MKIKKKEEKQSLKEKVANSIKVFLSFFKLGLFSFGGGATTVSLLEGELIERRKWITKEELVDMLAIAESTPGPIAINMATYVGFKRSGVLGSIFATLGIVLPSFIIIFIISLFFEQFLKLEYVQYAFEGIQVAIVFLLFYAGFSLAKHFKKDLVFIILFIVTLIIEIVITILAFELSSIYLILAGGLIGIIYYGVIQAKKNENKGDDNK